MSRAAELGRTLALAGAVFAGAALPADAQQRQPDSPIGNVVRGMDKEKMRTRTNTYLGLKMTAADWASCWGGKRNTQTVNSETLSLFEMDKKADVEKFIMARLFMMGDGFEDKFLETKMPSTFKVLKKVKQDLDGFLSIDKDLKQKLEAILDKYRPGFSNSWAEREQDIFKLADLACAGAPKLKALVLKMLEVAEYPKIYEEMVAVEREYGPLPDIESGPK